MLDELDKAVKLNGLEKLDVILGGDFNSYDRESLQFYEIEIVKKAYYGSTLDTNLLYSPIDKLKEHGFVDSYRMYSEQHYMAEPYFVPSHTSRYSGKVDYIFVNKELSRPILGCYQIMDNSSDHTPLVIDILTESRMPKINLLEKKSKMLRVDNIDDIDRDDGSDGYYGDSGDEDYEDYEDDRDDRDEYSLTCDICGAGPFPNEKELFVHEKKCYFQHG